MKEKEKKLLNLMKTIFNKENDRSTCLETPIDRANREPELNGIDLSKLPIKSQKMVTENDGSRTLTIVLEWIFR